MKYNFNQNEVLNCMLSTATAKISINGTYWNMVALSERFGEYAKKVPYSTSLSVLDGSYGIEVSFAWLPKKPFGQHNGPDCTEIISMSFEGKTKTVWSNDKSTRKPLTDEYEQVQNIINNAVDKHLNKIRNSKDRHRYSEEWLSGHQDDTIVRSRKKK